MNHITVRLQATILFCCTTLLNLIAPATVLVSYELTLEYPSTGGARANKSLGIDSHAPKVNNGEPDPTAPQDCRIDPSGVNGDLTYKILNLIVSYYSY